MERKEKAETLVRKLAAEFLNKEHNHSSLITVTRADLSPDFKNCKIFFTVLPENKEADALAFLKRKRSDMRDVLKDKMDTKNIPFVDFTIDLGEKNRQQIDELLR